MNEQKAMTLTASSSAPQVHCKCFAWETLSALQNLNQYQPSQALMMELLQRARFMRQPSRRAALEADRISLRADLLFWQANLLGNGLTVLDRRPVGEQVQFCTELGPLVPCHQLLAIPAPDGHDVWFLLEREAVGMQGPPVSHC